ncbi:MAG: SMC-Scp complex subunit ScpB [Alphaproteobacteria bacterium]|jgi:segregation and condensation protein B|nr:SMC-Scp complex subunit ScpB [Alphaproteobacteria bacterium]
MSTTAEHLRMVEALFFAAEEALDEASLAARLPDDADVPALIEELAARYQDRGVNLVQLGSKWQFRTAPDLRYLLEQHRQEPRRLSRAGLETLAIIAYHQPITRAEIEEVRGVGLSKGTLDILMEIGWVRPRGRKRVPGRPVTYGTTDGFLQHFGLEDLKSLPGLEELKAAGLLDAEPPPLLRSSAGDDDATQATPDLRQPAPEGESPTAIE